MANKQLPAEIYRQVEAPAQHWTTDTRAQYVTAAQVEAALDPPAVWWGLVEEDEWWYGVPEGLVE